MRRLSFFFMVLLAVNACGKSGGGGGVVPPNLTEQTAVVKDATITSSAHRFKIIDLGANVVPSAINLRGAIVGTAYPQASSASGIAFLYEHGRFEKLGTLPGDTASLANDINDSGTIIGTSLPSGHAVLFADGKTPRSLGTASGAAVNNAGQLVGTEGGGSDCSNNEVVAFNGRGDVTVLAQGTAVAMNASGYVLFTSGIVGTTGGCVVTYPCFVFANGSGGGCPAMPADWGLDMHAGASDVNDAGDAVGYYSSTSYNGAQIGWFYDGGIMRSIPPPKNAVSITPSAINNSDSIVGSFAVPASNGSTAFRAFLSIDGTVNDLNALIPAHSGWNLSDANDINADGYIVGQGKLRGQFHGFELVPR